MWDIKIYVLGLRKEIGCWSASRMAVKRSAVGTPEVDLGEHTFEMNKVLTLALRPQGYVTRNSSQGYQWPQIRRRKRTKNTSSFLRLTVHVCVGVVVGVTRGRDTVVQGAVDVVHHAVEVLSEAGQLPLPDISERAVLLPSNHCTRVWKNNNKDSVV